MNIKGRDCPALTDNLPLSGAAGKGQGIQMVLFITSEDVKSIFDMQDFIDAVEESYRLLGQGAVQMLPRIYLDSIQWSGFLKLMPANVAGLNIGGLQVYTSGTRAGVQKVILLFDGLTGALQAVLEADRVSWMRTGAASGVATKYLARKDARVVGIFGSGRQARSQLWAISAVRRIERVNVYSPDISHRREYCREMEQRLGIEVVPVKQPAEAVRGADIISTATTSRHPVFNGAWVADGTHINAVGAHYPDRHEVDESTVAKSRYVADSRERALKEEGELLIPMAKGMITAGHIHAELADVVVGRTVGRQSDRDITLFSSGGIASEVMVTAARIYARALSRGVGQELKTPRDDSLPRALYTKRKR